MNEHIADATEMIACPFCGRHNIGTDYGPYRQWVQCFCHDCGASAASCDSEVLAIAAWNQRYLPVTYSVDNATVTVNDLRTATLFRKQEAELTELRANAQTLARIAYANGCLSAMRAAELTGLSLPDIMHKVQSGEWPEQGEMVDAERVALRALREACERLIIASKRGGQRVPQAEWYAMVEAYEKASAAQADEQ